MNEKMPRRFMAFLIFIIALISLSVYTAYSYLTDKPYSANNELYLLPFPNYEHEPTSADTTCKVMFNFVNRPANTEGRIAIDEPTAVIEAKGDLFRHLPLPTYSGYRFTGWYLDPTKVGDTSFRVNGASEVQCHEDMNEHDRTSGPIQLYGGWEKNPWEWEYLPLHMRAQNAELDPGIPIVVFHQFTDKTEGDGDPNHLPKSKFEEFMRYIADAHFYLPTWEELQAYMDDRLDLPANSVIITDDDCSEDWMDFGVNEIEKNNLVATSFVITGDGRQPGNFSQSKNIFNRSHTNDLHHYSKQNPAKAEIHYTSYRNQVKDFQRSIDYLGGVSQVLAFPYGQYDRLTTDSALKTAGFDMAVTIEPGKVYRTTSRYRLPRQYVTADMTLEQFKGLLK